MLKLPPAMVPLLRLPLVPLLGSTSVGVSSTPSGTLSLPKLGVVAPPVVCAVTVAVKLSPAFTKREPAALVAPGLTRLGLAVCLMLVTVNRAGAVT